MARSSDMTRRTQQNPQYLKERKTDEPAHDEFISLRFSVNKTCRLPFGSSLRLGDLPDHMELASHGRSTRATKFEPLDLM
jgi:hypothetical protein